MKTKLTMCKLLIISTCVAVLSISAKADIGPGDACFCQNGGNIQYPGTWQEVSSVMTTNYDSKVEVDNDIDSANPCPELKTPENTCNSTTTGTEDCITWSVSGGLKISVFDVSGNGGATHKVTYGANCNACVNNWCQWAHAEAGIKNFHIVKTFQCSGSSGYQCPGDITGLCDKGFKSYCKSESYKAKPSPPCNPKCP